MPKRTRTEAGMYSKQATAAAINMAMNARFPYKDYGRIMHKRGTSSGISKYGSSYRAASGEQRATRKSDGYYGSGMYTGRGEYGGAVTNELMAGSVNKSPSFQSVADESGSLIVSHKEYIGDIFAPGTAEVSQFTVQSFPINPGLEQSFPWLSQIAQNYEEYELIQCVYEFQSTVQDINSANGQVGTIITATQYNSSLPDFRDKPAMQAYAHAVSGKSTDDLTSGVECDPSKLSGSAGKYIRANPTVTGEDLKTYDHGRFQLATHNLPPSMASGTMGELYCAYTIKLRKPKFFTGRGLGITSWEVLSSGGGTDALSAAKSPFWENPLFNIQNNIEVKMSSGVTNAATRSAAGLPAIPAGFTSVQDLTIPAYFAGDLEIQVRLENTTSGGGGSFTDADDYFKLELTGNVAPVFNVWAGNPYGADQNNWAYKAACISDYSFMRTFHLRVEPSTNAIDNVLTFVHHFGGVTGDLSCSLSIKEYNTFGVVGKPVLANAAGVVQELPGQD